MRIVFAVLLLTACSRHRNPPTMTAHPTAAPSPRITTPAAPTPLAERPSSPANDKPFTVHITAAGAVMLDGRNVSDADLRTAAVRHVRDDPEREASIVADPHAPYASVVHAMDVVRDGGLSHMSLSAGPPPP